MARLAVLDGAQASSRQEEVSACKADAILFCPLEIPDEPAVAKCLERNIARISPACRRIMTEPTETKPSTGNPEQPDRKALRDGEAAVHARPDSGTGSHAPAHEDH